jgi:ABC-type multidrug transport system permease subunit
MLGINWYWWVLALVAIVVLVWILVAQKKKQ